MRYQDATAVITGAASGIGRALAVELASRGANLALSDVEPAGLDVTVERCRAMGVTTRGYRLDVSERKAVFDHAEEVAADFGRVNMVFNNAGVAVAAPVETMSWDDIDWLMGVNFWGVVHGTKAFLPKLIASGEGYLVNVSSVFGFIGVPTQSAYNASKFAVRGFTEALRQEMIADRRPVTVCCVHPGGIRTDIVRHGRIGARDPAEQERMVREFARVARTSPEKAATTILRGVERKKARILVGGDAYGIEAFERILGARYQAILARASRRGRARFNGS